jgi:ornithine cyclodeaminase
MKPQIFNLEQIQHILKDIDIIQAIEDGFVLYSQGDVVVPPVGELTFEDPPGDTHIKYGYIKNDAYYVIKIASGFYENFKLNIPNGTGLMLLFKQETGELAAILLDEGYLTDVRTAAAGAVVAKYLAPKDVYRIGIFGAGVQGRLQVQYLKTIIDCDDVFVWGVNQDELDEYQKDMEEHGYHVETTLNPADIAEKCNLIITATPAKSPLLQVDQIREGTHITAMGSDTPEKQELDTKILEKSDIVVADSIAQCLVRGEIHQAMKAGFIKKDSLVELGDVISDPNLHRKSDQQITVADLTGVAVQDIQISKAVYEKLVKIT